MLWRLAFLLALAVHQVPAKYYPVTYVENLEVDQNDAALGSRIVSGWDAELGQHPHQAALRLMNAGGRIYNCGGSIVHKEWVITAAHCTANQLFILVRAGLIELWNPEAMVDTMEYYVYPTYSVTDPRVQVNDISLVRLPQPLVYSKNLHSIRIQSTMETYKDFNNELLYASGFGRTWTNGPIPTTLQWVYLRGVSNQRCASLFGTSVVNFNTICAGFYNVTSQSICHGDSGGPLVQLSPEGEPILVGVSSFVANVPHGCHSGIPGAFVRPGAFHWWFTSVTGIDFDNLNEDY